jgi:serine/threonine protein kinase
MLFEKIGRYEIKSEIGRGGMATVYHAYDPNFERDVAIKILPRAFVHDPQFRERFLREAKMIASLEHPAIVPVYDFGEEDSQPYIVMRYMAGGSIAERLQQRPLTVHETLQIITRLAPALDAAHARGIIHRDLKPGNILFDQYGNAFLSDFGIARLIQQSNATLTGERVIGTPAYMSPEQVQGEKAIDGRSDIYALGVLIYQMLTGQVPYHSETATKVMMMHLLEPVPDILEARVDLPLACQSVIAKAMAKDPEDRFNTTAELASALENAAEADDTTQVTRIIHEEDQTTVSDKPDQVGEAENLSDPTVTHPGTAPSPPLSQNKRRSPLITIGIILLVLLVVGSLTISTLAYVGTNGTGPLAMLAQASVTATLKPTFTRYPPTSTPEIELGAVPPTGVFDTPTQVEPTETPTTSATQTDVPTPTPEAKHPVIGGADKIAYLNQGDIWLANLDGTDLTRLTDDNTEKFNLQWTSDGEAIVYISGNCAKSIQIDSGRTENIVCFNFVDLFTAFELSPDEKQVAITLDNQLYIVPSDPGALTQVKTRTDLSEIAECEHFAPFQRNLVNMVRWSNDGTLVAAELLTNLGTGKRANVIQLIPIDTCIPNPRALDNFPPPRFEMKGYNKNPIIQNFDWNGLSLFTLTNNVRNDGFGDLYFYSTELHTARFEVNPIDGTCCYRDPHWSPDGSHIVLAYQSYLGGANSVTQLYLIPYGSLETGANYLPLPLPEITDPREKPNPILRPAQIIQ